MGEFIMVQGKFRNLLGLNAKKVTSNMHWDVNTGVMIMIGEVLNCFAKTRNTKKFSKYISLAKLPFLE